MLTTHSRMVKPRSLIAALKTIRVALRCFVSDEPRLWTRYLPWAEWSYNTSWQSSIKMTPFEAVYGRPPPTIPHYVQGNSKDPDLDLDLTHRTTLLASLKENTNERKIACSSKLTNTGRKKHSSSMTMSSSNYSHITNNLSTTFRRYYGPYKVIGKIGTVAYKLELLSTSSVHPVFHVSLLREYKGPIPSAVEPMPESQSITRFSEKIVAVNHDSAPKKLLVKWLNTP